MYRDDSDAVRQRLQVLDREAEALRRQNESMKEQLLAIRQRPWSPHLDVYQSYLAGLSPAERAALAHHRVTRFPVWLTGVLHLATFGLFSVIHFGLKHDELPRAQHDDPTAGRSIGYSFIPFFNLYWVFFNSIRLADRINLQFRLRGMADEMPRGLMIACSVLQVIPYLGLFIGIPVMWTIGAMWLQHALNKVADLDPILLLTEGDTLPP
jgi:hypothetical protein